MTQEPTGKNRSLFDVPDANSGRHSRAASPRLRTSAPGQEASVIVSGRREVEEVLRYPEVYSSAGAPRLGNGRILPPLELDPPAHTAWRAALDPLMSPTSVDGLAATVRCLAVNLIERFVDEPEIDFATEFSVPFPAQVLMTLLGLPLDELPWFLDLKDGVIQPNRVIRKPLDDPEVTRYRDSMTDAVYEYFGDALDQRAQERTDDLLSRLLDVEVDGERLSRDDLLDLCFTLLTEGVEPVSAALDCSFALLAEYPELRDQVAASPRQALEELLRWETPVVSVVRTAIADSVLGGYHISAGQRVFALLDAANIDPVECADAGVLRWDRDANRHLAFGAGIHRCLGSHLARLQLSIALREWHARIPDYSVQRQADLCFTPGVRTVDRFPMRLGRQR